MGVPGSLVGAMSADLEDLLVPNCARSPPSHAVPFPLTARLPNGNAASTSSRYRAAPWLGEEGGNSAMTEDRRASTMYLVHAPHDAALAETDRR